MDKMTRLLGDKPDLCEKLFAFGRNLYRNIFNSLGWDPRSDDRA